MLGLRLRVHDVLLGLAALKPRRIRRMTTDEGQELLCNIQGTIATGSSQFRKQGSLPAAQRTSYQFFGDLLARFAVLPIACKEMAGPPSPCASHSEVCGRLGTRKFDQMRIKICFSPIKPLQILQRTCLVRLLVPNLCSYRRLANGAVKIISAKRILAFDWSMDVTAISRSDNTETPNALNF